MTSTPLHEFHLPGKHDQSTHGRRRASAPTVPSLPAATPAAARPRRQRANRKTETPTPGTPTKPKLADLVRKQKPSDAETVAQANAIYGGTFGGLTAKVTSATPVHIGEGPRGNKTLVVSGVITDSAGQQVGVFDRNVTAGRSGAKGTASHLMLEINSGVQGQGFSEAFNANAIDWYRDNGIGSVTLNANIDVGGYAWARAGYDWDDENAAEDILDRVETAGSPSDIGISVNGNAIPARRLEEQRQLARDLLARARAAEFGSAEYPTPYEVSQLGRWPGAGKDDMWIGKAIMLGSNWWGVRYL